MPGEGDGSRACYHPQCHQDLEGVAELHECQRPRPHRNFGPGGIYPGRYPGPIRTAWSGWTSVRPCVWSWKIWCCPLRHRWGREPATKPWWSNLRCWPSSRGGSKTNTTARTRSGRPSSAVGWLLLESCDASTLWGLNPWGCRDPPCTCSATRGSSQQEERLRVVRASHLQHWFWLGCCAPRSKTQAASCSERHCRPCVQRGGCSMGFVRMPERMPSLV